MLWAPKFRKLAKYMHMVSISLPTGERTGTENHNERRVPGTSAREQVPGTSGTADGGKRIKRVASELLSDSVEFGADGVPVTNYRQNINDISAP